VKAASESFTVVGANLNRTFAAVESEAAQSDSVISGSLNPQGLSHELIRFHQADLLAGPVTASKPRRAAAGQEWRFGKNDLAS
jgi:hypothetical protein